MLSYQSIGKGGFRLSSDSGRESLLSRYGILKNELRRTVAGGVHHLLANAQCVALG